jgi:pyridoxine 5-phosphate synthase
MIELGVNIDHVATVRQARRTYEPDPIWAAAEAELGGADCITVHLREDRRHIQDRDVTLLRQSVQCKFNLEMSLAPQIVDIALQTLPHQATLVPERREEVTTEGGLDIITHAARVSDVVRRLTDAGVMVSAFIDPDESQVRQARDLGFAAIELHTGTYANAQGPQVEAELAKLQAASNLAVSLGLRLHAGHGLNYRNTTAIALIPHMAELNIGHAIISRAIFTGLRQAVTEMKALMNNALLLRRPEDR